MISNKIMFGVIVSSFIIVFALFFLIVDDARQKITSELLEDKKIHGETMVTHNAKLISNEFEIILEKQKKFANLIEHAQNHSDLNIDELAVDAYNDINSKMHIFSLSIGDQDNIIKIRVKDGKLTKEFVGQDTSNLKFVKDFHEKKKPMISEVFIGLDGEPHLALTYPIFDDQGKLTGTIKVILDPTGFFQQYDGLFNMDSDTLIILDKNQQIVKHSIPELIGESIFGEKIQSRINSESINKGINEQLDKAFSGNNVVFNFELDGVQKLSFIQPIFLNDEQIFTIIYSISIGEIYSTPQSILFNAEAGIFTLIIITGAITFFSFYFIRKQYLERTELEKLSIMGELSARLAHDIRNPLSIISMAKDLLKKNDVNGKNKNLIASIDDAVYRISHQVNVVLDFVRSTPSSFETESLKMILGTAIKNTRIPDRIKVSTFSSDSIIQGDFHQLENVFINILSNSIQAIPETGEITINVIEKLDFVDIEISDSGHGISDNVISKIFDPLFTTKQQGTGLGLVSCKRIIENHGGSISVKNNPTTFTVRLPVPN